jgi:two-component system, NarL family, nitrate/nitrite response regulator NarL
MTSVLLADDHQLFTDLVGAFLVERGIELAGVAASAGEALAMTLAFRPDVCLVEACGLATGPATSLVARLTHAAPSTRVVVLTGDPDDPGPEAAAAAGAAGHLLKSASGEELVDAITRVARGEPVARGAAGSGQDTVPPDDSLDARRRLAGLRARERECLELIVAGASTEEMAATMGVTVATVRSHVRAVLGTLGVHSRLGAASFALRHGLAAVSRAS